MATLKDMLNKANPQELADFLRYCKLGDMVRSLPVKLVKQVPVAGAASNYNLSTIDVVTLPTDAKAAFILRATGRAGTTVDEYTPQAFGATPATTQCAVTPCGDIGLNRSTDAVTDLDILYVPEQGEVVEIELAVTTGVLTLPSSWTSRGVLMLLEAEATAGTITGKKTVLVPLAGGGAGLPATTKAQLTSNKTTVSFNNATDAVSKARVKCLIGNSFGLHAALAADTPF
jgi:hypothetical protein